MSNFKIDIFTPSRVIARDIPANDVIIPTVRGDINVLPEHTHLITKLDTGVLKARTDNGVQEFVMTTGIVKILNDKITILAQAAESAVEVSGPRAKEALEKAKKKLNGNETLSEVDLEKFRLKLTRALIRTELAQKYKSRQ